MLAWDNKYELGHQRIDAEHRIFLSLLSDFQMAMEQGLSKRKQINITREIAKPGYAVHTMLGKARTAYPT